MRIKTIIFTIVWSMALALACGQDDRPPTAASSELKPISMEVGGKVFAVTLQNNTTAEAFSNMLPLTLEMSELHGNEKYHYLSTALPTNSRHPDTIHAGDLMLYGDNCIVVFYETFPTRYAYSPIGKVDLPAGLKEVLGAGSVTVKFLK